MRKYLLHILIITIIFAFIDQLTKNFVSGHVTTTYTVIENFFSFSYRKNTGIAFSIPVPIILIIVVNIILLSIGFWIAHKELNLQYRASKIFLGIILGGAVGNLIDRITKGFVIDFIGIWKWPVFNVADIGIVAGILGIMVFYGKIKRS